MASVRVSVKALLDHLAAAVKSGRNKPATREYYRYQFNHLLRVVDPDIELSTVTATDIFRGPLRAAFIRALRRLFHFHGLQLPRNVTAPRGGQRQRTLSLQEFRRLRYGTHGQARWILWFMYNTGARPRELRELTWSQVSIGDRLIRLTDFKCRESRGDGMLVRYIPLPKVVARVLAGWQLLRSPGPGQLVFTNQDGKRFTCHALRIAVRRGRERAGLREWDGEEATAYSLRHTFATEAVRAGMRDTLLAEVLGHADLQTTRRYMHRTGADLVRECDRAFQLRKKGRQR